MSAATATMRVIERFRVHGLVSCASLAFEQNSNIGAGLSELVGEHAHSLQESQVLVRHNVDDEDLSIVYVDGPAGPPDDVAVLDSIVAVLQDTRRELARFQKGEPASAPAQDEVDSLRQLLDLMADFASNDQRARYLLSSNWMRDRDAAGAAGPGREAGR